MEVTVKLYESDIKILETFRTARIQDYESELEELADDPVKFEKNKGWIDKYTNMEYGELIEYFILLQ